MVGIDCSENNIIYKDIRNKKGIRVVHASKLYLRKSIVFFSAVFKALNGFWNFAIRLFVQFINDAFWWQQTIYSILFSHAMIKYQAISKMLSKINALQDNNHLFIYLFYLLQQATKWKKKTHTPSVCFACLLCFAIRFLFYFISICSRWHEQQNQNEWKKTHW